MHGVRFCSIDQLYIKFSGNDAFSSPKLNEDQKTRTRSLPEIEVIFPPHQLKISKKKRSSPELDSFFREIRWKPKRKRSSLQFATIFGRKYAGSFSPGWLFFLCSSSAQLSMGGRLNFDGRTLTLDGGTLNLDGGTRLSASPLQFKYWLQRVIETIFLQTRHKHNVK